MVESIGSPWLWAGFSVFVLAMLAIKNSGKQG